MSGTLHKTEKRIRRSMFNIKCELESIDKELSRHEKIRGYIKKRDKYQQEQI